MWKFLLVGLAGFLLLGVALPQPTATGRATVTLNGHHFTLPQGFTIELAAPVGLVPRPITADFDEQGRLYVADSSGSNDKAADQLAKRPHRILRLDGKDGKYDRATVFADRMMFPEGTLWHDGSLYVAAPPSIWKLTDTNGDGVADERSEWFQGKTLTGLPTTCTAPTSGLMAGSIGAREPSRSRRSRRAEARASGRRGPRTSSAVGPMAADSNR